MSIGEPSREHEPSAFGWIFAGVMAVAGLGAALWAATDKRRDKPGVRAESDTDPGPGRRSNRRLLT